jgi:poly(3-hydroxybutyrate) depolymerase
MEDDGGVLQSRRALTQVQALVIVVIIVVAGVGAYFLGLIPGTKSIFNTGSFTSNKLASYFSNYKHSTTPIPGAIKANSTSTLTFTWENQDRRYTIHVPPSYDPNKPTPLVLFFRDSSVIDETLLHPNELNWSKLSDKEDFILVYPFSVLAYDFWFKTYSVGFGWGNDTFPSVPRLNKTDPLSPEIDDVGFTREIIYRVFKTYNLDPDRIYSTGQDGGMAQSVGVRLSEVIAAVGSGGIIANYKYDGTPWWTLPQPKEPVSFIGFDAKGERYEKNLVVSFENVTWSSVTNMTSWWVRADGCSKVAQNSTFTDGITTVSVYSGGMKGTEVVTYISPKYGIYLSKGTDPTWNFFKSHPKQH